MSRMLIGDKSHNIYVKKKRKKLDVSLYPIKNSKIIVMLVMETNKNNWVDNMPT